MGLLPKTFAATLAVLPGGSIQEKVDLAQPGDIVAIFGGTYAQDVTVNKAIRLSEVDGEDVTITGNVTFTGITNAPPFEGFVVGSPGKGITITNTTGFVLKNVDARPGLGLVVNGTSKVGVAGGFYSKIDQDGGELTTSFTQVAGNFISSINSAKAVAFRTTVAGNIKWSSLQAWFGYSVCNNFEFNGSNSKIRLIASEVNCQGSGITGVSLGGGNNLYAVHNCVIKGITHGDTSYQAWVFVGEPGWGNFVLRWFYVHQPGMGIVISGSGHQVSLINNYIQMNSVGYVFDQGWGVGIQSSVIAKIYNNIISGAKNTINAPYTTSAQRNFYHNCTVSAETGGVLAEGSVSGEPLFVVDQAPKLQVSSPCINAGINDPIYNDLDGSHNDIGPGGGCLFDPDGWTTANPVVISFDIAPQQLLRGVDTQVTLSNGQAVSQP